MNQEVRSGSGEGQRAFKWGASWIRLSQILGPSDCWAISILLIPACPNLVPRRHVALLSYNCRAEGTLWITIQSLSTRHSGRNQTPNFWLCSQRPKPLSYPYIQIWSCLRRMELLRLTIGHWGRRGWGLPGGERLFYLGLESDPKQPSRQDTVFSCPTWRYHRLNLELFACKGSTFCY